VSAAKKTVVVGMSGGVDSSVAAFLLARQGYEVIGLFMHNWEEDEDGHCTSAEDWADALAVANKLKLPCYSVNFAREYQERVFADFLDAYKKGRTPNPDVLCNREIKFGPFSAYAKKLGADFVATGHYCAVAHYADDTHLLCAADRNKDQTYFLNQVRTAQLENVLFPLGGLQKTEVRKIAAREGLVTAKKRDSTGICFIGERKFRAFLKTYLPAQPGDIVDTTGKTVGRHEGLMYYTPGQRRGLDIGGVAGAPPGRWYVVGKDLAANRLTVSAGEGDELYANSLTASGLNLIGRFTQTDFSCQVRTRHRQEMQAARAVIEGDRLTLRFDKPQRAVTPGQYAVLYLDGRCLGGAMID
jgi:tRNA-specific 2-thiouridylase